MAEKRRQTDRRKVEDAGSPPDSELRALNCEQLAWRSQQGSQAAFAELVNRYGSRLQQFLSHRMPTVQDAEDLVQDTFVRAYENIHLYNARWKFSTWLFTIARRLASSHYRRPRPLPVTAEIPNTAADPADLAVAREDSRNIWTLAGTLPENQFRALWLRYVEQMSIRQIARVLGKSQVSAKVLLYRARVNLGDRLKKEPRIAIPQQENDTNTL